MNNLSFEAAKIELLTTPRTQDALRALLDCVSVGVPTGNAQSTTVLYSGILAPNSANPLSTVRTSDVVISWLCAGAEVRVIDETPLSRFLLSEEFRRAVADTFGLQRTRDVDIQFTPANEFIFEPETGEFAAGAGTNDSGTKK
jgi:hypothetical protein